LAGRHEPSSGGSFYLSVATAALRAALVIAAFALGIFVLSKAFPGSDETAPIAPQGGTSPSATPTSPSPGTQAPTGPQTTETHDPSEVTVQILNGTDVAGLAEDTATLLEDEGYDVPTFGNAQQDYDSTQIFYRPQFQADAESLGERFFPTAKLSKGAPNANADITIVLEDDYAEQA
jgi:LytR cell envelope-related transcriptional attenuator